MQNLAHAFDYSAKEEAIAAAQEKAIKEEQMAALEPARKIFDDFFKSADKNMNVEVIVQARKYNSPILVFKPVSGFILLAKILNQNDIKDIRCENFKGVRLGDMLRQTSLRHEGYPSFTMTGHPQMVNCVAQTLARKMESQHQALAF